MPKSIWIPVIDNGMGLSRTSWALSMMGLLMSDVLKDRVVTACALSYPYPDGAMQMVTADFLESGLDSMLIVDTDIQFEPKHVAMLLEHDVPLVAGLYPKKQPKWEWPVVATKENPNPFDNESEILCEVECVARGFMRIDREVFEALKPHVPYYDDAQTKRKQWEFWKNQQGGNSEDFNFCRLYRSIGGHILIDKRAMVKHIGSITYPIRVVDHQPKP